MTTIVTQPCFFPWLGFWHRLAIARQLVSLDNVQFNSRDYQHRAKVGPADKDWLTVGVKGGRVSLNQVELEDVERWFFTIKNKACGKLGKVTYEWFSECIEAGFSKPLPSLPEFNISIIQHIARQLQINDIAYHSAIELVGGTYSDPNSNLIACLRRINSTSYICGAGSRGYLDEERFGLLGIDIIWHNKVWSHPVYSSDPSFVPGLSILHAHRELGGDLAALSTLIKKPYEYSFDKREPQGVPGYSV